MAQKTEKSMEKGTESRKNKRKSKGSWSGKAGRRGLQPLALCGKYGCVGSSGTVYIDVFRRCFPTASAADKPL